MGIPWEDSYVGQLRQKVGHSQLIVPSIRAILCNEQGDVLWICRAGENRWALPAGAMELGESLFECLQREVREETGLEVLSAVPIALYTSPQKSTRNGFGDEYQMFEMVFRVDKWVGELVQLTDETTGARFFPLDQSPPMEAGFWQAHTKEVLRDWQVFAGSLIVK